MKKLVLAIVAIIILSTLALTGCDYSAPMQNEYDKSKSQISTFQQTQPIPEISFSNTRQAVIDRINRWNDPNKISYVYLVSYGRVMAFYTVKGSVESKQSYLSPVTAPYGGGSAGYTTIDMPDVDGTYGDNLDSIFFFTTDGVYVEWHGDYLWVDQPLKFQTAPELYYDLTSGNNTP